MASPARQRGVALVVLLALVGIVFSALLISALSGSRAAIERDQQTARALQKARDALLAYAVSVNPGGGPNYRPGDFPCPDRLNNGSAGNSCSTSTSQRIGRLPWRALELDDLRDGSGERLWYVLSGNFDRTTGSPPCAAAGDSDCLNSETVGTITVRDAAGNIVNDGTSLATGVVAVLIAPGAPITRQGGLVQDRSCTGDANPANCQQTQVCSSPSTALCNPVNYLDVVGPPVLTIAGATANTEDNATFTDGSTADGLISGPISDSAGNIVVNDRLLVITQADLMQRLVPRIAREAMGCVTGYAGASAGRFPFAAPVSADYSTGLADQDGTRFGRLPVTLANSGAYPGVSAAWPVSCAVTQAWWANWRNLVFYGVAADFAPPNPATCGAGCLTVNPPSATDKRAVIMVAGPPLASQTGRGVGAPASQYLEDVNAAGADQFRQAPASPTFNDYVLYQ
jgi:type II secretory pathway pseudopilin PulG